MGPVLPEVVTVTVASRAPECLRAVALEASGLGTLGPGSPPGSHHQETEKQPRARLAPRDPRPEGCSP